MLLFANESTPATGLAAAKRPDNKAASQRDDGRKGSHTKTAKHKAWPLVMRKSLQRVRRYFDAVGSGTGLSARVCR
jgi:hypothetical protein